MSRTALELLRLLAQDAPAEQIEEQARRLAAADPDDGAAARDLALRVRSGLDTHRRREAELTALVDTARDLASLPDPGGVLDAIVRRARTLFGADVAYLTLHDTERGDTYMRTTSGSVSARFQALRLPLGAGLGGLVAQTHRPYWSADYPRDEQFRHTNEIDAAELRPDAHPVGACRCSARSTTCYARRRSSTRPGRCRRRSGRSALPFAAGCVQLASMVASPADSDGVPTWSGSPHVVAESDALHAPQPTSLQARTLNE